MKQIGTLTICLGILAGSISAEQQVSNKDYVLRQIAQKIRANIESGRQFNRSKKVVQVKLDEFGNPKSREERLYRTRNILGVTYQELHTVNDRPLTQREKAAESRRLSDFIKSMKSNKKGAGIREELKAVDWSSLPNRYDVQLFKSTPDDPGYVLTFTPKKSKLPEDNRIDRVLNRLSGKVWVDEQFNIVRAEGKLCEPVKFGLGLIAKVDEATIQYEETIKAGVSLPAALNVRWAARIALLNHNRQELQVRWQDADGGTTPADSSRTVAARTTVLGTASSNKQR